VVTSVAPGVGIKFVWIVSVYNGEMFCLECFRRV